MQTILIANIGADSMKTSLYLFYFQGLLLSTLEELAINGGKSEDSFK